MNFPPEKKKKTPPPSLSSLPEELTANCLARISISYYPKLSTVSKKFYSLLSSPELYIARSHLGFTQQCLYLGLWDFNRQLSKWFRLCINPNRTTIEPLLVPVPSLNLTSVRVSSVAVGSEIYVIGGRANKAPSSTVRILDCRSHTWRDAPSMNVARECPATRVYDRKIYVFGGCKGLKDDQPWAEVFDTKTRTWECLPGPGTEVPSTSRIAAIQGKIYFGNAYNMYAYDTNQGNWECCVNKSAAFARSGCVMENVSYSYGRIGNVGRFKCWWYDVNDGIWKKVKGLESLYRRNRGASSSNTTKLVSFGGKLLLLWEVCIEHNPSDVRKIWCAEIALETRDGGEVWGNVEWVDVVHNASGTLSRCLAVSV